MDGLEKREDGYSCKTRSKAGMDFFSTSSAGVKPSSCGGSGAVSADFVVYGTGSCPFFCIYEKTPGQKTPGCSAVSAGADALSADF